MKWRNLTQIKLILIVLLILSQLLCLGNYSYAVDEEEESSTEETEQTTETVEPHVEMRVSCVKVGETTQVIVECWAKEFVKLESLETVMLFDGTVLQPSTITGNEMLENLDRIKYANKPTNKESKEILAESFEFDNAYKDKMDIHIFKYLAPNGNYEALQFEMSKTTTTEYISADDYVLLGKFSFIQINNDVEIIDPIFSARRIRIVCDRYAEDEENTIYSKETSKGENYTDLMEFVYQRYGSISGTVKTMLLKSNGDTYTKKNIATIKLYKKEDVKDVNWTVTKTAYTNIKNNLPEPIKEVSSENDNNSGNFVIYDVPYGEYVILVCKDRYADYVITDVLINYENKELDLNKKINSTTNVISGVVNLALEGKIELLAGDVNGDGHMTITDYNAVQKAYNASPKNNDLDVSEDNKMTITDYNGMCNIYNKYKNKAIKTVISLKEDNHD